MAKMSGSRLFVEVIHGYGVTHVFYVPTIISARSRKWMISLFL